MSKKVIERVALASFTLADTPIALGQIVELDSNQFARAVAAGCVHMDDAADEAARKSLVSGVSKPAIVAASNSSLQPVQVSELQAAADAQISRFDELVNQKRDEASGKIAEIDQSVVDARTKADLDIEAIRKEVETARSDADTERSTIAKEISDAREKANEDLATLAEDIEKAKKTGKEK